MAARTKRRTVETLLEGGEWDAARTLIDRELSARPDDHWLLTQRGVTFYEQGRYRESLRPFLSALAIVPDCPLTLWNLAGALDALGKPEEGLAIYTWLLKSDKSPADDECWESDEWTAGLKTDCVYRVGVCFRHMKRRESAENCFRQYVNLLLAGMTGTYTIDDAARQIRELAGNGRRKPGKAVRDAIGSTLQDSGVLAIQNGGDELPDLAPAERLAV